MKLANITLLVFSVVLAGVVLVLASLAGQVTQLEQFTTDLGQQLSRVAPVSDVEPYGGCDEAARYPNTPGWTWCHDRGYLD